MSTDKNGEKVSPAMVRLRDALRRGMANKGWSARELSRQAFDGKNVGYVGDILEGRSKKPEIGRIIALADALEMPMTDLVLGGEADFRSSNWEAPRAPKSRDSISQAGTVPLYAARLAMNKAFLAIDRKPASTAPALHASAYASTYAFAIPNEMNEPRYFAGETVYVSPAETVRPGDFVFVRRVDGMAGVLRLMGVTDSGMQMRCIGARDGDTEHHVDHADIEVIHRVVASVS